MMFTLEEVKKAVGGRLVSKTDENVFATSIEVTGVSTDTRTIKEGAAREVQSLDIRLLAFRTVRE